MGQGKTLSLNITHVIFKVLYFYRFNENRVGETKNVRIISLYIEEEKNKRIIKRFGVVILRTI
jgi:hypothetical protein